MKRIRILCAAILAILLLTAGSSAMAKAEEAPARSGVQVGKGLVVEGSPEGYTYEKGTLCFVKEGSYVISMAPDTEVTTDVIMVKGIGQFGITLNSVRIETRSDGQQGMPLSVQQGDLSLTLAGSSSLKSDKTSALFIGNESGNVNATKLTVDGSGKLDLRSQNSFALENLGLGGTVIKSGQIRASNAIVDSQEIKAVARPDGASEVFAISAHFAAKLTVNGGALEAEVEEGAQTPVLTGALYCYNGLEVNGGTVSGKAPGTGVYSGNGEGTGGTCDISGGTVIGDAVEKGASYGTSGIFASGEMTISGGSVTAKNGYVGLTATKALVINGGRVEASGSMVGINGGGYAEDKEKDTLEINGGTVYAQGSQYALFGGDFSDEGAVTCIFIRGGSVFTGGGRIKPDPLSRIDEDEKYEVKADAVTLTGLPQDSQVEYFLAGSFFGEKTPNAEQAVYGICDMLTNDKGQLCVYIPIDGEKGESFGATFEGVDYEGTTEKTSGGYTVEMKRSVPEMAVTSEKGHAPCYFGRHFVLEPGNSTAVMTAGKTETDEVITIGKPAVGRQEDASDEYYRLTLDNVRIHSESTGIHINHRNTEIITKGENDIKADEGNAIYGHYFSGDGYIDTLVFGGDGSLSCDVIAERKDAAILCSRKIIINSGTLTAHSPTGAAVMIESKNPENSLTINGGHVNVKGPFGLYAPNLVVNGGSVTGTDEGDEETLVLGSRGSIALNGGSVNVNSRSYAVGAEGSLTISGGNHRLLAENDNNQHAYSLYANGSIQVSGGTTWVSGGTNDILAEAPGQSLPTPSGSKAAVKTAEDAGEPAITLEGGSLNAVHNTVSPEPVDASSAKVYKTKLTVGAASNTGVIKGRAGEKALNLKDAVTDEAAALYLYLPDPEGQKAVIDTSSNTYRGTVREQQAQNGRRTFGAVLISDKPEPVVHVTGIRLDRTSAELIQGKSLTLTATIEPDNATNKKVSWKSSDARIAQVDSQGRVTGAALGKAVITVTTEDGGKTASAIITVKTAGSHPHTGVLSGQAAMAAALVLLAGLIALAAAVIKN